MTDATGSFPCTHVFAAPHALTRELRIYFIFLFLILVFSIRYSFAAEVLLTPLEDRVRVTIDDKHFTDYIFRGHLKPILFPILGPGQVPMTRSWPIIDGIAEELFGGDEKAGGGEDEGGDLVVEPKVPGVGLDRVPLEKVGQWLE